MICRPSWSHNSCMMTCNTHMGEPILDDSPPRFGKSSTTPVSDGREAIHWQNECATKKIDLVSNGLDRMPGSRCSFVEGRVRERARLQDIQTMLNCPLYSLAMRRTPVGVERPRFSGLCGVHAGDQNDGASRYRPVSSYPVNAAKRQRS
jgi:hypothetical protein